MFNYEENLEFAIQNLQNKKESGDVWVTYSTETSSLFIEFCKLNNLVINNYQGLTENLTSKKFFEYAQKNTNKMTTENMIKSAIITLCAELGSSL